MAFVSDADPTRESIDAHVARLAATQYGVFSRTQLTSRGATDGQIHHRLRTGRWTSRWPGVYRLAGAPFAWRSSLMEACLTRRDGAVVSHEAAAALRALAGFERETIHVIVAPSRRRVGPGVAHRVLLDPAETTVFEGLPVTTVARTLIDVAARVSPLVLEVALDDALRRGLTSIRQLDRRLEQLARRGRPGVKALRELLGAPDRSVSRSVFETRLRRLMREGGLPARVGQHRIEIGGGKHVVADFAFPEHRLIIEADGYAWHSGRERWERDLDRRNELTLLGWRIVHVTWRAMVRHPAATTEKLRRALRG